MTKPHPELGPKTRRLLGLLDRIATLLRDCDEAHWRQRVEADAALIRRGDIRGLDNFVGAFGGMGSFNDLVLCTQNGHRLAAERTSEVNEELDELRRSAHTLARAIRSEAVVGN